MCSLLQDVLKRSHQGEFSSGEPVFCDLAPRVRRRIILDLLANSSFPEKKSLPSVSTHIGYIL